ncbi:MAG: TIM barrel protein [Verrucomicrobia bacterium]|nr:TIM barrel protein [Verrucomicrobiota bacterium]MDA1065006.1 TIM barrel protein [Verrucomicrobiota bacterium]
MNRRSFLKRSSGFCLGGLSLSALPLIPGKAHASGSYKIGLSMYSLRFLFQDGSLSVFDYPAFSRKTFGLTEIDVWDGAFPKERKTDPEYFRELKKHADEAGTNLFLLMAGAVDANGKTLAERKAAVEPFKAYIDNAVILRSTFVRVFLKAPNVDRGDAIAHCIDALQPIARYAKEKGIIIAIEPGASEWAKQGDFLADIAREMNDPHLRLMPDFGKMKDHDPYGGTEAMMPFTSVVSAKSHNFDDKGNEVDFDYHRLMKAVIDADFKGIVAIEYEGKVTPPVEGVLATKHLLERFL